MTKYKHIFLDLDHTLWDHDRNADEALQEIYQLFDLQKIDIDSVEDFVRIYQATNHQLWADYEQNKITSDQLRHSRFRIVFSRLGVNDHSLCDDVSIKFLEICPNKPHLIDGAMELLEFLYPKYPLHLITNGFDDIQGLKMEASGITGFFGEVITSHRAGEKKPHPQIFEYAMQTVGVTAHECIMIGDNWIADILGAKNIGIDTIWYNPHATPSTSGSATYEVRSLRDIPWDIF